MDVINHSLFSVVENFLEMACSTAFYGGSSNKEYASHILHRTRGSVKVNVAVIDFSKV